MEALEFFYAHTTAQLLAVGTVLAGGGAVLATVEPWLLAAVLPAAALLAAAPFADARGRAVRGARTRSAVATLSADTVEVVDGLRELLAFGTLAGRRRRLAERGRQVGDAQRAEATWEAATAAIRGQNSASRTSSVKRSRLVISGCFECFECFECLEDLSRPAPPVWTVRRRC
ncbi:hypothetical protein [Streptomyces lavendofoliae]|uniref:ABC transmembrane type-1 domain-containing protein n=1 Tax=Streptomyces lavendofoliae TaxID=67314 RepID=A0A918M5D1_9ACTN|nr:hypothetical protein GCM10010274_43590 [Streptomyces lavendofoliae]